MKKQHPITVEQARELLLAMVSQKGSQRKVALDLQISPSYLNEILDGEKPISNEVAKKLGYSKVVMYSPIPHDDFVYQHNPGRHE